MDQAEFASSPLDLDTDWLIRENRKKIEANYQLLRDAEFARHRTGAGSVRFIDSSAAKPLYDYEVSDDDVIDMGR